MSTKRNTRNSLKASNTDTMDKTSPPAPVLDATSNDKMDTLLSTITARFNSLHTRFDEMNSKIDDVHTNLSTSLSTLETAHYATCSRVSELEARFQTMSDLIAPEDITDLKIELTLHQQKLDDMEQDLAPIISDHANRITETNVDRIIETKLTSSTLIRNLIHQELAPFSTSSSFTTGSITRKTGFGQPESKDFHASRFDERLSGLSLGGDTLLDLESFHDSILIKLESITLSSNLFPKYKDLPRDFDYYRCLCGIDPYQALSSRLESTQALANYKSFGQSLRLFLIKPTTIPRTTCPETYLQLLSLRTNPDGFQMFQHLIFLRSPQLAGKYKDYRALIDALTILPGEHLREFYSRTICLSQEIELARVPDGCNVFLSIRFLQLLRDTKNSIIINETSTQWKEIQLFRRDPSHLTQDLPWTFETILRNLELADVTILSSPSVVMESITSPLIDAHAAYGNRNQRHLPLNKNTSLHMDTTPTGTRPSVSDQLKRCKLCNNQHPNPWHTESNCPFKDPTHILCKITRENVMQHNSLHGAINKKFSKLQDKPSTTSKGPIIPTILNNNNNNNKQNQPTVRFASTDIDTPSELPSSSPEIEEYKPFPTTLDTTLEIIDDEEYFDLPVVTPTANVCTGFTNATTSFENTLTDQDHILDSAQYLSYSA
jgi:hypothetical protein